MSDFGRADRVSAGASRELSIVVGAARTSLLQAIRTLGFRPTSEQLSYIEADRGSKLAGMSMIPSRVPVALRIDLASAESGSHVDIRVEDRWSGPKAAGVVSVYARVFTEVLTALDAALKRTDPAAAGAFAPWWRTIADEDPAMARDTGAAMAKVEKAWSRRTSRILDGPRRGPASATSDAGVRTVTFVAPDSVAAVHAEVVDGMLTAGQLIAAAPKSMPKPLVEQVHDMVVRLEQELERVGSGGRADATTIYVSAPQVPVLTFLFQQAALRDSLPLRLLMRCTTCRLERVVNPDLARMRERSRRIRAMSSSVGAVFGSHNISPFILVGRLVQVRKSEPDFVCARCQGTDADQQPITFCPRCGDRRNETVLRSCPHCDFDLRSTLQSTLTWHPAAAAPALVAPALPMAETAVDPAAATVAEPPGAPPPEATVEPAPTPAPAPAVWTPPAAAAWTPPPASAYGANRSSTEHQPAAPTTAPATPPGWYPDPWRRYELRYWDGRAWTAHVASAGVAGLDAPADRLIR